MKNGMHGKPQGGFTLIEIAIILVIIGLLLGGVLQGQQLIENSRIKSATNDFNGIAAAVFSYQDRYGRLPGDDGPLAALRSRDGAWAAPANANLGSGDADGILDAPAVSIFSGAGENSAFFQHLRLAGLITGNPSDTAAAALPQNPFGGVTGVTSDSTILGMLAGNKICMSNVAGSSGIALDTQLDNGDPATGRLRASAGDGAAVPATAASIGYDEDSNYTVCYRM